MSQTIENVTKYPTEKTLCYAGYSHSFNEF